MHILFSSTINADLDLPLPHHELSLLNFTTLNDTAPQKSNCTSPSSLQPPATMESCRPVLLALLDQEDVNSTHFYTHHQTPITIADYGGCLISITHPEFDEEVEVSKRLIVACAWWVLLACNYSGWGGWTDMQGFPGWIVVVRGSRKVTLERKEGEE
ncbi:hypothetical protein ACLMJK_001734 [Lecanora helva]